MVVLLASRPALVTHVDIVGGVVVKNTSVKVVGSSGVNRSQEMDRGHGQGTGSDRR